MLEVGQFLLCGSIRLIQSGNPPATNFEHLIKFRNEQPHRLASFSCVTEIPPVGCSCDCFLSLPHAHGLCTDERSRIERRAVGNLAWHEYAESSAGCFDFNKCSNDYGIKLFMITEQEYKEAIRQHDAAEKIIQAYGKQSAEEFDARWERFSNQNEFFKDEDLTYSADSRCEKCGAGLAHPKACGGFHQWTCSNVLKGIGTDSGHGAYSFAFYEIKSENQPSANGATTRPK
jgi:hypothetical protein